MCPPAPFKKKDRHPTYQGLAVRCAAAQLNGTRWSMPMMTGLTEAFGECKRYVTCGSSVPCQPWLDACYASNTSIEDRHTDKQKNSVHTLFVRYNGRDPILRYCSKLTKWYQRQRSGDLLQVAFAGGADMKNILGWTRLSFWNVTQCKSTANKQGVGNLRNYATIPSSDTPTNGCGQTSERSNFVQRQNLPIFGFKTGGRQYDQQAATRRQ